MEGGMTAYWIGRTKIIDMSPMAEYQRLAGLAAKKYPFQTLVRGGRFQIVEGTQEFDRFVVHEFPSTEAAMAFYNSPEYQAAVALRMKASAGRSDLVVIEGV
jgi:uncharacterized protein (DUF1330 family)